MRANSSLALLALLMVAAGPHASTRGDEVGFSDIDVRLASYEESPAAAADSVHAAFLSDSEAPQTGARLVTYHRPLNGLMSGRGDQCPECALGGAWQFGPSSNCGTDCGYDTPDACSSCGSSEQTSCGCNESNLPSLCDICDIERRLLYGEVQIMWLRTHLMEDALGKLSEQYKFSPRVVVGYEDPCGIGARLRYWHYDHTTETLDNNDFLNFRFDVVDAEVTSRFAVRKTDLVVSGGFRWADIEASLNDEAVSTGMPGLTFAADLRTQICGGCSSQWAGVAGGRWSTLGGDWEGSSSSIIEPVRDDNMVVQELYAGVEYTCCTQKGHNIYARLTFEIQNWHSDAAAQLAGTDSIGFVGPGVHVGASY